MGETPPGSGGPERIEQLGRLLGRNPAIEAILERTPSLGLPNWYLGAGCLAQTVWNLLSGQPAGRAIGDYDLVYYDGGDLGGEREAARAAAASELFRDLGVRVDVTNEARVHLWYERHFGHAIAPYRSVEEAIDSWPTTATALAVRALGDPTAIYAPFGLADLFAMIVRPNRRQITAAIYRAKVERWRAAWPGLTIVPWDG